MYFKAVLKWLFRLIGFITAFPVQLIFFKRKVINQSGLPRKELFRGGALVISNHYNVLDYANNLFIALPRFLGVAASEMPYRNWFLRWGMSVFNGIEVDREHKSMRFIDDCAEAVARGQLIQIFPESRNTPDGEMHPFKTSYLMIALRSGADILPIVTDGNYGFFKRTHVVLGQRIPVSSLFENDHPTREEITTANEKVFAVMLAMKELADGSRAGKEGS